MSTFSLIGWLIFGICAGHIAFFSVYAAIQFGALSKENKDTEVEASIFPAKSVILANSVAYAVIAGFAAFILSA